MSDVRHQVRRVLQMASHFSDGCDDSREANASRAAAIDDTGSYIAALEAIVEELAAVTIGNERPDYSVNVDVALINSARELIAKARDEAQR